ncbi:MAG: hypothetical protein AB7V27_09525 [Candidatus Binatia bacterium]
MSGPDDAAVRAYAAEKRFAEGTLSRWLMQDAPAQIALLAVAERLRLGDNQFRAVLDDVVDIAARRGCAVAAVLEDPAVRAVWARGLGRNEAMKALREALRRLRYPQLTAAEQRVSALTRSLRLPAGARLECPPLLEGEEMTLVVRGSSATQLRARAAAAVRALQDEALEELFAVLEGRA